MLTKAVSFRKDESGAVTVDWVVLTAGIVAVNIFLLVGLIQGRLEEVGEHISEKVDEASTDFGLAIPGPTPSSPGPGPSPGGGQENGGGQSLSLQE